MHEGYDFNADDHDIAVLMLTENARTGQYIYPICLPEVNAALKTGTKCYVTGKFPSKEILLCFLSLCLAKSFQFPITLKICKYRR